MTKTPAPSVLLVAIAFATVYLVWGSTYFFIQMALSGFKPFMLGTVRFTIAGLLLLTWCIIRKEKIFSKQAIKTALVTGLMLLFVGNGIVIWVEQFMPSAMVAIMVSAAPIWFVMLDKPMWRVNFMNRLTVTGLAIGFCGVILLFGEQVLGSMAHFNGRTILGLILLTIGSMSWSGGSLYSKSHASDSSAMVGTAWQMLFAGLAFIPGTFINKEWAVTRFSGVPLQAWLALTYLIIMGSIAAYSAYVWLLQVRPATQVSTYAYVNPVIAVALGIVFAHERISTIQIIGLIIILISVLLINLSKNKKAAAA
jgi:drug/metabolite transporter (DMT)-like permease